VRTCTICPSHVSENTNVPLLRVLRRTRYTPLWLAAYGIKRASAFSREMSPNNHGAPRLTVDAAVATRGEWCPWLVDTLK
jgi:hypothetical protein